MRLLHDHARPGARGKSKFAGEEEKLLVGFLELDDVGGGSRPLAVCSSVFLDQLSQLQDLGIGLAVESQHVSVGALEDPDRGEFKGKGLILVPGDRREPVRSDPVVELAGLRFVLVVPARL